MSNIFIQIASYRDPELVPTIRDCLAKASNKHQLTFAICWQKDETESLHEFTNDKRLKVIDHHWSKSKGLCWARSQIQKLWSGEEYTLQLDSHHRFAQNWDEQLIEMMSLTDSNKPIITSYAGMYRPLDNKLLNMEPYKMVASEFTNSGTILFRPHVIENWENLKKPIPARFVSGHYFFTIGKHCTEYKYDPNIYFAGDEISLSIRSFTLGYDLFHPHKTVVWHEYTREGRTKHWSDFNTENVNSGIVEKPWHIMDMESKKRLRHMLKEEDNNIDLEEYGLGDIRTHKEYEDYAGINFQYKQLHNLTLSGKDPPINDKSEWWIDKMKEQEYRLSISLPDFNDTFEFIYVGVEDNSGQVLYREDIRKNNYTKIMKLIFKSGTKPYKIIFWPHSQKQWLDRTDILI